MQENSQLSVPPTTAPDSPALVNPQIGPAARGAAQRGFYVHPLRPCAKDPQFKNWEGRATVDAGQVHRWSSRTTAYGIACGPSGLLVVDLDPPKEGEVLPPEWAVLPGIMDGSDVFAELCERYDGNLGQAYSTLVVGTPAGGTHLYYRQPSGAHLRNSARTVGPLIDTRGHGGYVVGPGSVTSAGTYRVIHSERPAELPGWLFELLTTKSKSAQSGDCGNQDTHLEKRQASGRGSAGAENPAGPRPVVHRPEAYARAALRRAVTAVESAQPGRRNQVLFAASANMRQFVDAGQVDSAHVQAELAVAAERAGLESREIRRTIQSGLTASGGTERVAA